MTLEIRSERTCSMGVTDMAASIAWYERVMGCALLYRADEIGWCELATPMAGVNIGLSEVESVGQGGGATNVFEVADIDAAKAHLDAEEIGRAHVGTPVTNPQLVCSIQIEKKNK